MLLYFPLTPFIYLYLSLLPFTLSIDIVHHPISENAEYINTYTNRSTSSVNTSLSLIVTTIPPLDVASSTTLIKALLSLPSSTPSPAVSCEVAKIRCALRKGCGSALQSYMLDCADLMTGQIVYCNEYCKVALIALTSSLEGSSLMDCTCSDAFCRQTKSRVEVCRAAVAEATANGALLSCSIAHLVCAADTLCSTALQYYDRYCRRMFEGRECTYRCNNSISILKRQEKAELLSSCECDGSEPFECQAIKENMQRLCFPPPPTTTPPQIETTPLPEEDEESNEIDTISKVTRSSSMAASGMPNYQLFVIAVIVALAQSYSILALMILLTFSVKDRILVFMPIVILLILIFGAVKVVALALSVIVFMTLVRFAKAPNIRVLTQADASSVVRWEE